MTLTSSAQASMGNSRLRRDSRVKLRYEPAFGRALGLFTDEGVAARLRAETRALKVYRWPLQRLVSRRGRQLLVLPHHVYLQIKNRQQTGEVTYQIQAVINVYHLLDTTFALPPQFPCLLACQPELRAEHREKYQQHERPSCRM